MSWLHLGPGKLACLPPWCFSINLMRRAHSRVTGGILCSVCKPSSTGVLKLHCDACVHCSKILASWQSLCPQKCAKGEGCKSAARAADMVASQCWLTSICELITKTGLGLTSKTLSGKEAAARAIWPAATRAVAYCGPWEPPSAQQSHKESRILI